MNWKKSSYSGEGNCVETASVSDGVAVRDSKQGTTGPVLRFDADAWREFIAGMKAAQ